MEPLNGTTLSGGLSAALSTATAALPPAMPTASDVVVAHSSSWSGLIGRLLLGVLHLTSAILYYVLRLAGFSLPSLLFNLFSTTLTVTMNATTL
jgi:lysophospholipid hydrolase